MVPMSSFSDIATTDLEGSIKCTDANETVAYSTATLRVFGECLYTYVHEPAQKYVYVCD